MLPPDRVLADTLAWRKEADRILGFWDECLIPDPTAIVLAAEVTEAFNAWLVSCGHSPWAKETFGPRFREHSTTKQHRAAFTGRKRLASVAGFVVRLPRTGMAAFAAEKPLPKQADVWSGFRFRSQADDV